LTALDAEQWHESLKQLAGQVDVDPAVGGEAVRRLHAGLLTTRDLRLVLMATGHLPGWQAARRAVIDALAHELETARQILVLHTQIEVLPPPQYEQIPQSHAGASVAYAARVGSADAHVMGPVQQARTSREAKDRAALALLARLAGVAVPGQLPAQTAERLVLPGMLTEAFEQRLLGALESRRGPGTELEEEALRRAGAGRLRHRDMYLLLFSAGGEAWNRARMAALERAAAMPPAPARLLHWYVEQHGDPSGLSYQEELDAAEGHHRVRVQLQLGNVKVGPSRSAWSRKTARHYASCALLAVLAGLPEPEPAAEDKRAEPVRVTLPGKGQDPVKTLNKHFQRELITRPQATLRTVTSRVECTYTCQHRDSGTPVQATAAGPDKEAARRAAALKLLHKLHSVDAAAQRPSAAGRTAGQAAAADTESAPAPELALTEVSVPAGGLDRPPLQPQDHHPVAWMRDAITAGCAITLKPADSVNTAVWWVHDSGLRALPMTNLPAPLTTGRTTAGAGWRLPLADGLPAVHQLGSGAHPSAVFWQRAVHIALQLVKAELVYPALDEEGRAVWRAGPIPVSAEDALRALADAVPPAAMASGMAARQALTACCDAVVDTLVRTPAAALFGDGPWTSSAPVPLTGDTQGTVRDWLDAVEDQADGGPVPQLILHVQPPSEEQAAAGRLTADLHLAPAGSSPDAPSEVPAARVWADTVRLDGEGAGAVRPRVRRVLRRAARRCPALAGLAGEHDPQRCTLYSGAITVLLEQEDELAEAGVRVGWPERLRTALTAAAVIGTVGARTEFGPDGVAGGWPQFSVTALLDFRWQLALDGADLTEEEMDALAEAARPLVRIRGQWVLADPVLARRARHRLLGQLPGTQALTAALTGTVTVAGDTVVCRPSGPLADTIDVLRRGERHDQAVPAPAGLTASLRDYQQRALTWLAHTSALGFGAVLADDMGLGKTLTALAFTLHHQQHNPGPTLVVCPASLVTTWCREAARFAPRLPVVAYHGSDRTLETVTDTTLVITTYGLLRRDAARLAEQQWVLVIADEAQYAKNPASFTTRQLRALPAATRLALTGTPVENNLSELWSLLDWTNPGLFGPLKTFRSRWANTAEKDPHSAEAAELGRVVAPFLLRRRKSDPGIAPELPAKIDQPRLVQLTTEQAALYEALVRETLKQIQDARGIERNGLVFKLLTALKQITNHPAHYLREQPPTPDQAAAFAARSAKTVALTELLTTIRDRGEAALVFTSYVQMGHLLTAHLAHLGYDPLFLHGTTPVAERQHMVDAFQAGRHQVMILSLKAAGTGLTLTCAAHVIHFDRSWNAAVEDQATDRAHRIGQHRTVSVHRLITEHTVEDRIDELLTRKRVLAAAVLTSGDQALTQLTDQELADLLTLGERR
jgi:superfamily II DNA or RNA helicase